MIGLVYINEEWLGFEVDEDEIDDAAVEMENLIDFVYVHGTPVIYVADLDQAFNFLSIDNVTLVRPGARSPE